MEYVVKQFAWEQHNIYTICVDLNINYRTCVKVAQQLCKFKHQLCFEQELLPFWRGNSKAIRVVFWQIYAVIQEFYTTAGRSGRAKYQLWEAWEVWDECEPTIWKFPNKAAQRKIRKVANEEPPPNIVQLLPHWVKLCFKRDNRSNMRWDLYWRCNFLPTNRALSAYKYFKKARATF